MQVGDKIIAMINGLEVTGVIIAVNVIHATVAWDAPVTWLREPHQQKMSVALWKELGHPRIIGRMSREEMLTHYQEDVRKLGAELWPET